MQRVAVRVSFVLALVVPLSVWAQGRGAYMNVESPPVHPIEAFRWNGHDYLAVVNTRDNSLEIFDSDETLVNRRLTRVRVGLEPVSVRFHRTSGKLYTANFLGDSISRVSLFEPSGPGSFGARLETTTWVGDEPLDIAFYRFNDQGTFRQTLFVTHMSPDGFGWRDAQTLAPIQGKELVPAQVPVLVDVTVPPDGVPDAVDFALKEPRTALVSGGKLWLLALKGDDDPAFDFDVYCDDLAAPFANPQRLGGLGTTGFNMTFDANGVLYVAGAHALSRSLHDEPVVAAAPTGFVKSVIYQVKNPCAPGQSVLARDVNLEPSPIQPFPPPPQVVTRPVVKTDALSMLTDVLVFHPGGGAVPKVFFTAYGNDRVGILRPDPNLADPNTWPLSRIQVAPSNGNPLAGPRGLAQKAANPSQSNDPGARIYVLNHLDASITTLDPVTESVVPGTSLSLAVDPRPTYLTTGQRFLYDANLSGNGFVSCASCHIDARTDRRSWDLGTPALGPVPIPPELLDGVTFTDFPADKNFMVTQSLQGLLNFEVLPGLLSWVTNAPYHWRGDRADFTAFKGAFNSLLGMPAGTEPTDVEMKQFEEFVNTIHYPPNPQQSRARQPSGLWDDGSGLPFPNDGSTGASRGLKIYHRVPVVAGTSCALCHRLAAGTNGRVSDGVQGQTLETAALRGLFQKEGKREMDGFTNPDLSPWTGREGLVHKGFLNTGTNPQQRNAVATINAFNQNFFSIQICGTPAGQFCGDLQALSQFVHEFDWGVGPLVGCSATVELGNAAQALPGAPSSGCAQACRDLASTLSCLEEQAGQANNGVAVQAEVAGVSRGFWFDPRTTQYVEEPAGSTLNRTALVGLVTQSTDRLVFEAVPLGSERRVASPGGSAPALPGPLPAQIKLLPMVTGAMYPKVPGLTVGWANFDNGPSGPGVPRTFTHAVRLMQWGLIQDAASQNGFGVGTSLHHDAPRRFQVSGANIRPGAWAYIGYFDGTAPPNPSLPLSQGPVVFLRFPIYPTGQLDPSSGQPIYQTAVELDPIKVYTLLLGGPKAKGVAAALNDLSFSFPMVNPALDQPPPGEFDPLAWNWHYVAIANADGTLTRAGWHRLTVAP